MLILQVEAFYSLYLDFWISAIHVAYRSCGPIYEVDIESLIQMTVRYLVNVYHFLVEEHHNWSDIYIYIYI